MSNDWVQFSDRKPKNGEEVLICFNGRIVVGFYDRNKGRFCTYIGALHTDKCWWKPLPERPLESGTVTE